MSENESRTIPDIFEAAARNRVSDLDIALGAGVDVNGKDSRGFTPLHYAAANLAFDAVDRLLMELDSDNPLDPTLEDHEGRRASTIALEVSGEPGIEMQKKLLPYCYPSHG